MSNYFPDPNGTSMIDIFKYANVVTGNMWGPMSLMVFFIIIFVSLAIRFEIEKALTTASFLTALVSYFFYVMDFVPGWMILIPTILTLISVFFLGQKNGY